MPPIGASGKLERPKGGYNESHRSHTRNCGKRISPSAATKSLLTDGRSTRVCKSHLKVVEEYDAMYYTVVQTKDRVLAAVV